MLYIKSFRVEKAFVVAVAAVSLVGASHGLNINLNANLALSGNSAAFDAFRRAADTWESVLTDDVTVTIDAGLQSLGASVLGSTGNVSLAASYADFRGLLIADEAADSGGTNAIVAALPEVSGLSFYVPTDFSISGISASKANLKALGVNGAFLDTTFGLADGAINFSSDFAFDYDNTDGVGVGKYDFESVAVHEIGHLLGFTSVVDQVDAMLANGVVGAVAPTLLDLFRFVTIPGFSPTNITEFSTLARSILPGYESVFSTVTEEISMSTGRFFGDGSQASHWKDDLGLGIMDPTLAQLEIGAISAGDLLALDVIGWDLRSVASSVPDAVSSFSLLAFALGVVAWSRRKRLIS